MAHEYWTDPGSFAVGQRAGRALVDRYDTLADLAAGTRTNRLDLAGDWDFEWVDGLVGFDGHAAAEAGPHGGGRIPVPGLWQLHGFGVPIYLANTYPPAVDRSTIPRIDQSGNEAGIYARTFQVPSGWAGRRISLVFEGAKSGLLVYLNGREVGYSQGSFTPAEFDVTDLLVAGENRLTAVVWRYTDGTYLEDQDMWFLSGIFRPVYLLAEPAVSMSDVWVSTQVDLESGTGRIRAEVTVTNASAEPVRARVEVLARGPGEADRRPAGAGVVGLAAGEHAPVVIDIDVPGALLWTAETPHLYELVAQLRASPRAPARAAAHQVLQVRTGIRVIRIADGQLLVNGRPVTFHGVNRHDFDPDHGWAVPEHRYREDLLAAKRLNVNAIRCAHYPNPQRFYDLCDELGLYVIDECDLETHGVRRKNVPGDNPMWTDAVVDRMERMVLADRNHPSIVMWSLGNEAGLAGPGGGNFARMRAAAEALDGTRPYHYEGDHQPGLSDVVSRMYSTAEQMAALSRGEPLRFGLTTAVTNRFFTDDKPIGPEWVGDRPIMLCEFAHAMGNSVGNFAEYIDVFHGYPNQLGGFIWDFVDQSIRRVGPDGVARWHYGGDFGESPNHRYFCNNGILDPDRQEHPSAREVFWGYRGLAVEMLDPSTGRYRVANRFSFTDAEAFDAVVEVRRDGALLRTVALGPLHVAAGGAVDLTVPEASADADEAGEVIVRFEFRTRQPTAWAPAGTPVAHDEFPLTPPRRERPSAAPPAAAAGGAPAVMVEPVRSAALAVADASRLAGRALSLLGGIAGPAVAAAGAVDAAAGGIAQGTRRRAMPLQAQPSAGRTGMPRPAGVTVDHDAGGWTVNASGARFWVDRQTGHLCSWLVAGAESSPTQVLAGPVRPNHWRALTDNDRGYGNIDRRLQHVLVDTQWRDQPLRVADWRVSTDQSQLVLWLDLVGRTFSAGGIAYAFGSDGSVEVRHWLVPDREMYRVGITLQLPVVERVRWYGKGPHENYIDRNRAATTAIHDLALADLAHRYIRPQENGNRTEVRWLEAIAPALVLRADDVTGEHLGFTAWPWTQEALDRAEHDHELAAGSAVTLNIDRRQRGVGGDLPGVAALLPAYTIPSGQRHEVSVRLSVRRRS